MKKFKDLIIEAKGLKKLIRARDKGSKSGQEERERRFSMRQAVRSAEKLGSEDEIDGVPSHKAIGAQFGVDVQETEPGVYASTKPTRTEDMALSGDIESEEKMKDIFRKTFLKRFSEIHKRSLGSY